MAGKVAIVTGGAMGIGRAAAMALAARGAQVMIADINPQRAEETAGEIRDKGMVARTCRCDVGQESEIRAAVSTTLGAFGGIDILFNNAALTAKEDSSRDRLACDLEIELWDRVMAVNLRGPWLFAKFVIPEMLKRGGGVILNTSSVASMRGQLGNTAYTTSKAGINGLTLAIATQYGKDGIRCNAIAPGFIGDTNATSAIPETYHLQSLAHVLTPYLGQAADIGNLVAFLASDEARYITGQIINCDGGVTSHAPQYADQRRTGVLSTQRK